MKKTYPFSVATSFESVIQSMLPHMDLETDIAFRRTLKSIQAEVKIAKDALKGVADDVMKFQAACVAGRGDKDAVVKAEAEFPKASKAFYELMKTDITFEVRTLTPTVLSKPWPQIANEPNIPVPSVELFKELLAELDMVRDE